MSLYRAAVRALAASAAIFTIASQGRAGAADMNFAVLRDGAQIGTNSVEVGHDGDATTVRTVTHVQVGFAFVTFYRFDQTESERWSDGRLVALDATTDDNGTLHRASAAARDGKIVVQGDGKTSEIASTTVPFNLWNSALVDQNVTLDPRDGSVKPVKVIDRGEDAVVVRGHTRRAHHYVIVTTFAQDVWYDGSGRLLQAELKGIDGSTIRYQLI
jgi:hypothetical protein